MDWSKQVLYRENYIHVLRTFVIIAWSYWADSAAAVGSASGTSPASCCTPPCCPVAAARIPLRQFLAWHVNTTTQIRFALVHLPGWPFCACACWHARKAAKASGKVPPPDCGARSATAPAAAAAQGSGMKGSGGCIMGRGT
jgi:hypothetical protein